MPSTNQPGAIPGIWSPFLISTSMRSSPWGQEGTLGASTKDGARDAAMMEASMIRVETESAIPPPAQRRHET